MLRLERTIILKATGEVHREVAYALSSLDRDSLDAAKLLTLWRQHWHIENRVHYVCDVTLGEDAWRRCLPGAFWLGSTGFVCPT